MPKKDGTIAPVHPNVGVERAYRRKLLKLIDEMNKSTLYWLSAAYKANTPEIAQDASPAKALEAVTKRLASRWQKRFNSLAKEMAVHFSMDVSQRSKAALMSSLKRSGLAVEFQPSKAMNDVLQATIAENTALIKSIPQQYMGRVQGAVMRSVQTGRDLESLYAEIMKTGTVTKKRAALIARDQNNKATATFTRVRQSSLGVKEAIWVHSAGDKTPRPSHLKAGQDRIRYNILKGWFDPDAKQYVLPGELINCRCVSRPVIPGLENRI